MSGTDHPVLFGHPAIMRGRIDRVDDVVTLALAGEFDLVSDAAFTATMTEIEATNPRQIVVDVQELAFMDATGAHGLLEAHRRAAGDRSFAVLNGSGPAHRLMQLVGLDEVLSMVDSPAELPQPPREPPPVR